MALGRIAADDFFQGIFATALEDGELVTVEQRLDLASALRDQGDLARGGTGGSVQPVIGRARLGVDRMYVRERLRRGVRRR